MPKLDNWFPSSDNWLTESDNWFPSSDNWLTESDNWLPESDNCTGNTVVYNTVESRKVLSRSQ